MSDRLTPERIRDAAEVVSLLYGNTDIPATGKNLRLAADRLELRQAAEAKREKRIEDLARELYGYIHSGCTWVDAPQYIRAATQLLDAYPALAESPAESSDACGKGPCSLNDGHPGRCEQ